MRQDRVRVFEPDPAAPAGALPIFGEFLDRLGRRVSRNIVLSAVMTLLGVGSFFLGTGLALPVFVVGLFGTYLVFWTYSAGSVPPRRLKRVGFRLVESGTLVAAGSKVGVRLPDGQWLHLRLPAAWRLQLAGQGRLWLLGEGKRVFAGLPGNLTLQAGRVHDGPPAGATPLPQVPREPTSPRLDAVLVAHRRFLARVLGVTAVACVVFGALATWVRLDLRSHSAAEILTVLPIALFLAALLTAKTVADHVKPLNADNWTELRLVPDGPIRLTGRGLARLAGRTMLADGREVGVRLTNVDPSMAANIATTGQLWVAGRPGRTAVVGVPGYPVTGLARFLR